jgi:basic amino acid/polyamine antiporter, APA family
MVDRRLQARLSLFDALAIVAGTTIGSGIFIVSAGIAREVSSPPLLLMVWIAASAMSLTGALTVVELAAMMPFAGAQYLSCARLTEDVLFFCSAGPWPW